MIRSPNSPRALLLASCLCVAAGCAAQRPHAELTAATGSGDPLAVYDALETLIGAGTDTLADRELAYEAVRTRNEDTAPVQFARAAVTGRLVQARGLLAANLVPDIERCARRSRELDPNFRDGAATRLLGTLYVMAPTTLLQFGDSEDGLDLLEGLVTARPDVLENHLRLAEAFIALNDPAPAHSHLCLCLAHKDALRGDDQMLLSHLVVDAGALHCD